MTERKTRPIAVTIQCAKLLDEVYEKEGIVRGKTIEKALIEKYPEIAKKVGLK